MKIDSKVEEPLRRTIGAVVDKNSHDVVARLERLDDEQAGDVFGYAALVVAYVMRDVFDGDVDAAGAGAMANRIVQRVSEWADIDSNDQVAAFLLACASGDAAFTDVEPDDPVVLASLIAGDLLSHYRPEGMRWFEYLDKIWNYAESQPDPA